MRAWRTSRYLSCSHRTLRIEDLECRQLLSVSPVGEEFTVGEWSDTSGLNSTITTDISTNSAGNFAVVWQGWNGTDYDIYARRFDAEGNAHGSAFLVSAVTAGNQIKPAVALGDGGQLVVTWQNQAGSEWAVAASFYDGAGNLLNGDVLVGTFGGNYEPNPDVAISSGGRVLIVIGGEMLVRSFDTNGVYQGDAGGVVFTGAVPKVGFAANGDYVVAGFELDHVSWQRFDSSDSPQSLHGYSTRLAAGAHSHQFAMNRLGEFIVAAIDDDGVHAQRVGVNDMLLGIPVDVPVTSDMNSFALAMDAAGNFAVGTINISFSPTQTWNSVYFFNADNTINDVLTFDDRGVHQFQPPALSMYGTGQGVVILNRHRGQQGSNLADLTAQRLATDSLFVSGLQIDDLDIVDADMVVPLEVRRLDVRLSREASIVGGNLGVHSILNLANWQLWRGNSNVSDQIESIENANGKVTLTLVAPLATGNYRLIASDAIQDTSGNSLDGDQDGAPGGGAERRFAVSPVRPVGQPIATDTRSSIDVAANSNGQFATVSLRSSRIRAQFFASAGVPTSGELSLAIVGNTPRMTPKAFLDETANLHVFWTEESGLSYWATYNSAGVLQRPILVLSNSAVAVAMADDGRVAVLANNGAQLYNPDGTPSGNFVPREALGTGSFKDITFLNGGDVIIAEIRYSYPQDDQLLVHRVNATGEVDGSPVLVDSLADFSEVTLAANPQGGFAVAWQSVVVLPPSIHEYPAVTRSWRQVGVRSFDAQGTPLGLKSLLADETTAATLAEYPLWAPAIDFDNSGRFVVSWHGMDVDGDSLGVAARGYFADGTPQGPGFRVSTPRVGLQSSPTVAVNSAGQLAIGWLHSGLTRLQFFELFDQPSIDLNGVAPGLSFEDEFTPDQFTQPLAANLTINDVGYSPLYGARVEIRSTVPGDQLLVDTSGTTLSAAFASGVLSISGEADRATYEHVLRTVRFQPAASRITSELIELDWSVDFGVVTSAVSTAALTLRLPGSVSILNRSLFYNGSSFDGSAAVNAADELARATDKVAYVAGSGPTTSANVSSYTRGITGIMIDLSANHAALSLEDFEFRIGNSSELSTWQTAPPPVQLVTTALAPGTNRLTITWSYGVIKNTWLEVTMLANETTGLAADDVFYFGSRVGDAGLSNTPAAAITNIADQLAVRANPTIGAGVENPLDFNRDGLVNIGDELASRANPGVLLMLNLPAPVVAMNAAPLAAVVGSKDAAPATSVHADLGAVASGLSVKDLIAAPAAASVESTVASVVSTAEPLAAAATSVRTLNAVALAVALADEPDAFAAAAPEEADEGHDPLLDALLTL